jgi:CheY-like chemotaxis protein
VLAATANAMPDDRQKYLAAGCNEYLPKPFTHLELGTAIERLLRQKASPGTSAEPDKSK